MTLGVRFAARSKRPCLYGRGGSQVYTWVLLRCTRIDLAGAGPAKFKSGILEQVIERDLGLHNIGIPIALQAVCRDKGQMH